MRNLADDNLFGGLRVNAVIKCMDVSGVCLSGASDLNSVLIEYNYECSKYAGAH